MDSYLSLRCSVPRHLEDELPELLAGVSILGTEVDGPSGEGLALSLYFERSEEGARHLAHELLEAHGGVGFVLGTLRAEDWLAAYREQVRAFAVGESWWIDPHPAAPAAAPKGRRRLVVPPRMAFGSGSHESTRLVLEAIETMALAGRSVLDVGTGSGILALAAERAGARLVIGLDTDATAVGVAREIARQQEWSAGVHFAVGSAGCVTTGAFAVVLCNMISEHFAPLLGTIERSLSVGGEVVLSGLLEVEIGDVTSMLAASSLTVRCRRTAGGWASLTAGRRS